MSDLNTKIQQFLTENGVYNAIVEVGGVRHRLNATQGILPPTDGDLFPTFELPDDLREMIEASLNDVEPKFGEEV